MDPVTTAIVAALAAGVSGGATEVGKKVIVDAYQALKSIIKKKYGEDSDLAEAVADVEKKPESEARQAVLQEEVEATQAHQDSDVVKAAQALLDKLEGQPGGSTAIHQQAGDNAIQIGQVGGDATIKR
jgi:hypothetical protein